MNIRDSPAVLSGEVNTHGDSIVNELCPFHIRRRFAILYPLDNSFQNVVLGFKRDPYSSCVSTLSEHPKLSIYIRKGYEIPSGGNSPGTGATTAMIHPRDLEVPQPPIHIFI